MKKPNPNLSVDGTIVPGTRLRLREIRVRSSWTSPSNVSMPKKPTPNKPAPLVVRSYGIEAAVAYVKSSCLAITKAKYLPHVNIVHIDDEHHVLTQKESDCLSHFLVRWFNSVWRPPKTQKRKPAKLDTAMVTKSQAL